MSVELVPPEEEKPKAEEPPPPPKPEEAKEEPPPPPPPPVAKAEDKPEPPPVVPTLPDIAIRPDPPQMDAVDNPAKQEEESAADQPKPQEQPTDDKQETAKPPAANGLEPTAQDGEIAAVKSDDAIKSDDPNATAKPDKKKPEEPKEEKPAQAKASDKLTKAKTLLANDTLADPSLRQMLGDLPPKRRIVQMCSIEALANIRKARPDLLNLAGLHPDPYKGSAVIKDDVLDAPRGAFKVDSEWYSISFHCKVNFDKYTVSEFSYRIGGKVTRDDVVKYAFP